MPKILLISPHKWRPACAPYGLEHIAHHLHNAGFKPRIIDCGISGAPYREIARAIEEDNPLLIGVSIRNLDTAFLTQKPVFFPLAIKGLIKKIKSITGAPVVAGGCAYSCAPGPLLSYLGADYGIKGPDEAALVDLVKALREACDNFHNIPGLVQRRDNRVVVNPCCENTSPLPAISRIFADSLRTYKPGIENHYSWGSVETKRGCTQACAYCIEPESKSRKIRVKPVQAVTQEIDELLSSGINWIWFTDSEFNLDLEEAKKLCGELIRNYNGAISWGAYMLPCPFDAELAELLEASGCRAIGIDAGHGTDEMLKNLGKGFNFEAVRKTAVTLSGKSINVKYSALLGGPGETEKSIREGLKNLADTGGIVELGVGLRVYPGTPFVSAVRAMDEMEKEKSLFGKVKRNNDFIEPVFYFSKHIAHNYAAIIESAISGNGKFMVPKLVQVTGDENGDWRGIGPGYSRHRSNELLMTENGGKAEEVPGASFG